MNSVRVLTLAAAMLAGGCGNYSTEDIRFLSALPRRTDLHVAVPAEAPPPGALVSRAAVSAACQSTIGDATIWSDGKTTSDNLNAGVDWIVGLIDVVRKYPPTKREEDSRTWGPFVPDDRPRLEMRITIARSYPVELAGKPRHAYAFEARWKALGGPYTPIIEGTFDGASSSTGKGTVTLRFDNIRALQMHDPTSPDGTMTIAYDRTGDPVTVDLALATGGFGVAQFDYGFAGFQDGSGRFDYRILNALSQSLTVTASWDPAKAGRLRVAFAPNPIDPPVGTFDQCWDAGACLVYVDDPGNFSCETPPCSAGGTDPELVCATVLSPPF